jgi:oligopeptide transport system substrate-binding protein
MLKHRAMICLLSVATLLAACTSPPQTTTSPQNQSGGASGKGGVLRIAWMGNPPKVLHPYPDPPSNTSTRSDVAGLFMAGLISFNADTLDYFVSPDDAMAAAMPTISSDGRMYTFTLREGLKWSDGQPVTSADFQFAWDNASKVENSFVGLDDLQRIIPFRLPTQRRSWSHSRSLLRTSSLWEW